LVALRAVFSPSTINVTVNPPGATALPVAPTVDSSSEKVVDKRKKPDTTPHNENNRPVADADENKNPADQVNPVDDLRARLDESLYLIVVEQADHYWAFVTCVGVGKDTLLTTAIAAECLAQFQKDGASKIWVTRPGDNLKFLYKAEVRDIRVMAPFALLPKKSADRFYVNIGLVTVDGPLPKTGLLASSKELDEVEEGLPIAVVGFTLADDQMKLSRFDKLVTSLTNGKVYVIDFAPKLPGQPKRLHIQAEMPKNVYGVVVNKAGKILGLSSDAIPESNGPKNLHYATMISPEQIDVWLRDRSKAAIWVPALPVPTNTKAHEQP
jgi:hypothetical protein